MKIVSLLLPWKSRKRGTYYGLLTLRFRTVFWPGCFQLQTKGSKVDPDTREMMPRVLLAVLGDTCRVLQWKTPRIENLDMAHENFWEERKIGHTSLSDDTEREMNKVIWVIGGFPQFYGNELSGSEALRWRCGQGTKGGVVLPLGLSWLCSHWRSELLETLCPWWTRLVSHPTTQQLALGLFILITWFRNNLESFQSEIGNWLQCAFLSSLSWGILTRKWVAGPGSTGKGRNIPRVRCFSEPWVKPWRPLLTTMDPVTSLFLVGWSDWLWRKQNICKARTWTREMAVKKKRYQKVPRPVAELANAQRGAPWGEPCYTGLPTAWLKSSEREDTSCGGFGGVGDGGLFPFLVEPPLGLSLLLWP